jgi:hypothetical protein
MSNPDRSLLSFAHKIPKNRLTGDFLPCKLRQAEGLQEPIKLWFLQYKLMQKPTSAAGS